MHFAQFFDWTTRPGTVVRCLAGLLLVLVCGKEAYATHNRAGEITYVHLEGLTYEVMITTYTKSSAIADRPWLYLFWGDENGTPVDSLERESIQFLQGDIQINKYRGNHTYGGPGIYEVAVEDPNRNDGVLNIPGSVDVPFSIRTLLIIDPLAGHNNSVQLLNPAQQNACLFQSWIHNPGAHDPDGDVLTYDLIPCRGFDSAPIPDYQTPDLVSPNDDVFSIDPVYGDLTWETPQIAGEYNVAIRIREWRMVNGQSVLVGEVIRDMQISVEVCQNQPPELDEVSDTCVVAGSFVNILFHAEDPDGDAIAMDAVGGPLTETVHSAIFTDLGAGIGQFVWSPQCEEVREEPYQIVVRAEDNSNQVTLMDLETVQIRVIAPAVIPNEAIAIGNSVLVDWESHACLEDLSDWQISQGHYDVYRLIGENDWEPGYCVTGVPVSSGYEFVAEVNGLNNNSWVDTETLSYGATYCYRIVTHWPGSGESLASEPICATIAKDVPVMTESSVQMTDVINGVITVGWSPPYDADTLVFTGPYAYQLFGWPSTLGVASEVLLHETASGPFLNSSDTTWTHTEVNTADEQWSYRVLCISDAGEIGVSAVAESPWLTLVPNDNQITLQITATVPWSNDSFRIYREDVNGDFEWIGSATEPSYVDTGLVNNTTYCYRVECIGGFDGAGISQDLINWSQTVCGDPIDLTPPCPPLFSIESDCALEVNQLMWQDVEGCADDLVAYAIYWAPVLGDSLELFQILEAGSNGSFTWNEDGVLGTIAGCFAMTALDSLLPGLDGTMRRNESAGSDTVCVDNCPYYFLPNVFTPNGDNLNDRFESFPWKFVESVDFRVYNRWGQEVFQTTSPSIEWTGEHRDGGMCADGVYYYSARVFTIRLVGVVEEIFSGEIQLINGGTPFAE